MTIKNILDEHTTYGETIANLFPSYNMELPEVDISKIPALTSRYATEAKNFRVTINGDPKSIKSIKSFTWVNPLGTQAAVYKKKTVIINEDKAQETKLKQIKEVKNKLYPGALPKEEEVPKPSVPHQIKPQTKQGNFLDNIPDSFH